MEQLKKSISVVYPAVGGPSKSKKTGEYERIPTKAGSYIIGDQPFAYANPKARYVFSRVAWGVRMRLDKDDKVEFRINRQWVSFAEILSADIRESLDKLRVRFADAHPGRTVPPAPKFPERWILNDYGHITIAYFSDKNKNRIRDRGERIENDLIHPTPFGEYQKTWGVPNSEVKLEESHGCIHMTPQDIDDMIARGYAKKGTGMFVHPYSEVIPEEWNMETNVREPYQVHYFPGVQKIVITGEI